jgi:hypothetical protein
MEKHTGFKRYHKGDQIHILVTRDFVDTATEFFRFCRKHRFNPSEVMRGAIADWLEQQKEMRRVFRDSKIDKGQVLDRVIESYERSVIYEE